MMKIRRRWQTAVGVLGILLLATACLQTVGDQGSGPQISMVLTETATPTPTEEPSLTPTTEPEETEEEAVDLPIAEEPTETPSPTSTVTETQAPTETPATEVAQLGDGGLGQILETPEEEIDSFSLTATMIVASATAQGLVPTWTADALTAQANQNQQLFTPAPTEDTTGFGDLFTATSSAPVLSGADCVHEVRAGDTLFRMSLNYGIPVMDIATRNGITNPDLISIGQMLVINGCGTTGVFPPATSIPTESAAIGGPDLSGSVPQSGGGGCTTQYTVQQYDNLFQISLRYGVPVQSIANANGIANINIIDMGSVLCIPAS